jgi:Flp pilus assembly protein TadD
MHRFLRLGTAILLLSLGACAGISKPDDSVQTPKQVPAIDQAQIERYISAADAARDDGRFDEAMQIYQQVLVSDGKSTAAQFGVAECLIGLSKPAEALTMFDALAKDPAQRAAALQGKGLAQLALGKREQAAEALRDAVAADPSLWRAYNGLGLVADYKRDFVAAADGYNSAIALKPDSALLFNNRGYSSLLAGKLEAAIADLRKALGLEPSSETMQNNLRLAVAAKGDYAGAVRMASAEQMPTVLNNVGYVAMQRGDLSVAEGYFARAMEQSPSFNTVAAKNLEQVKALEAGRQ